MALYEITVEREIGMIQRRVVESDGAVNAAFAAMRLFLPDWRVVGCLELPDPPMMARNERQGRLL